MTTVDVQPVEPQPVVTTPSQFRSFFTAFGDQQAYPDGVIQTYMDLANRLLDPARWVDMRPLGMALFTAHYLVLDKRDEQASAAGRIPGLPYSGLQASKSVGGVSVSYETQGALEQGAGFWNLTTFGLRFYRLMMLVGMAGTQLGGPDVVQGPGFGPAWPGVIYPH